LGALKVAVLGAIEGWQSTYLGCNLPAREIASAATELGVRAVALSLVYPERDPLLESELRLLVRLLPSDVTLIVGGEASHHYKPLLSGLGVVVGTDMRSFREELRRVAGNSVGSDPVEGRG
jgi:hypothetical protein